MPTSKLIAALFFAASFTFTTTAFSADTSAATPAGTTIEVVSFLNGFAELALPVSSSSVLKKAWPADFGDLSAHLQSSYTANCNQTAYAALTTSTSIPVQMYEIPELNQPSNSMDRSIFENARCLPATVVENKSGFSQAQGLMQVKMRPPRVAESSDRRLVRVTMPWKKSSGWDSFEQDKMAYQSACQIDKAFASSTLFLHCSEPATEIACCGNAVLSGHMNALVFAYSNSKLNSFVTTAPSTFELTALNQKYLVEKRKALGSGLAFSICTPPSFEYAPVMAYQSTCYTYEQTYTPANPTLNYCESQNLPDLKVWVLRKHDDKAQKDYLEITVSTKRFTQSISEVVTTEKLSEGMKLTMPSGLSVRIDGKTAILSEGNASIRDLPATDISLTCRD